MKYLRIAQKAIRRLIIVVSALLLIGQIVILIPWSGGGFNNNIQALYQDGPVTKVDVKKTMDLEGDLFKVKELYITPKQVALQYTIRKKELGGWSFPGSSALKLVDSNGNELIPHSSGGHAGMRGESGFIYFDPLKQSERSLVLTYDWYDRHAELSIPLKKEGEGE